MWGWLHSPTQSTTSAERGVIVWVVILLLAGFGGWFIYLAATVPPERAEPAGLLMLIGIGFVAAAVVIYVIRWLLSRWAG